MKYFFILKEEHKSEGKHIHRSGYSCLLYSSEEDIKHIIQTNQLDKFNKVLAFKVGSVVKLVDYEDPHRLPDGWIDDMSYFLGATVKITWLDDYDFGFENDDCWSFTLDCIETVLEQ